jgi:hypothetical protein
MCLLPEISNRTVRVFFALILPVASFTEMLPGTLLTLSASVISINNTT